MHILVVAPARRSKNKTENDTPPTLCVQMDFTWTSQRNQDFNNENKI